MNLKILLLVFFSASVFVFAEQSSYEEQQNSSQKALNELDGKGVSEKDLQLMRKDLEIERLKLELEKQKFAEEKQKNEQQIVTADEAPSESIQNNKNPNSGVFIGIETYGASGTRTYTISTSGNSATELEHDIDYAQQTLKLGIGELGDNRLAVGFTFGKDIRYEGDSLYKSGTSVDIVWDIVMSSLYQESSQSNLLPFFRLGFGVGSYEYLDEDKPLYVEDTASSVEVKFGFGVYYQIDKTFELALSYDFQTSAFAYEDVDGDTMDIADSVSGLALGFNVHF
ncbi:MAG: hypothetical protein QG567_800 [Campylobacterota bacterium]|nr:hypothetical protein [Campylobacterota bacterium]